MWHFWLHPLRGLAALGVVFLHCYWTWAWYDAPAVRKLYLFVDFFFVLSGFVISSGYANKIRSRHEFLEFFRHRFRRLSFQYLTSGAIWALAVWFMLDAAQRTGLLVQTLRYVLFLDVFFESERSHVNPVAWSVMAEFWIYGLFAVVTLLLQSLTWRLLLAALVVLGGVIALATGWRDLNLLYGPGALLRALTGFFLGVYCWIALLGLQKRAWCHAGLLALLALVVALIAWGHSSDLLAIPLSALVVVAFVGVPAPTSPTQVAALRWLGDISYPLYLWHFILSVAMAKVIAKLYGAGVFFLEGEKFVSVAPVTGTLYSLALIAISLALSYTVLWVERRVLALNR